MSIEDRVERLAGEVASVLLLSTSQPLDLDAHEPMCEIAESRALLFDRVAFPVNDLPNCVVHEHRLVDCEMTFKLVSTPRSKLSI
ncbi:hypothetical protein ASG59_07635 [Methylobacterium sp. Leaf466]|nr:hypothetical protein ASG59_07635 [Methylobacterium sp. Leaf466]